ncbi:MAG: DUF3786 domain-containing protein [Thermodesulfobacteriota bacterium]
MPQPKNAMEIFKFLDKSNCQQCGEKTCLAFAGAVFKGRIRINECPKLDRHIIESFSALGKMEPPFEDEGMVYLKRLQDEISSIDLAQAAERVGARFSNHRLTLKVLGKDFSVDSKGTLYADIHINPWVAVPFLNYILNGKGILPSGNWVSFRELREGKERYPLFKRRCEESMKQIADRYTGLFDDMVHIFGGKQVEKEFKSDISVVLHPLPRIPLMVCYWLPEEDLESSLNLYFDDSTNENLDIGSVFNLGVGLAQMFRKLSLRHGHSDSA